MNGTNEALDHSLQVVQELSRRLEYVAPWVDAEVDGAVWECVSLLWSMGHTVEIAQGLIAAGADSADPYAGSVLETGVFGRGLLYQSIDLCIRIGVMETEEDVRALRRRLDSRDLGATNIVVAYLDYLGMSKKAEDIVETCSNLGRKLSRELPRYRWQSYYWTSSDSFCLFGILNTDHIVAQARAFLLDLVWVQEKIRADGDAAWKWQIGATVASARVLGDMVLPSRDSVRAVGLMKLAKRKNKGGGLIAFDAAMCGGVSAEELQRLLATDGQPLAFDIIDSGDFYELRERLVADVSLVPDRIPVARENAPPVAAELESPASPLPDNPAPPSEDVS